MNTFGISLPHLWLGGKKRICFADLHFLPGVHVGHGHEGPAEAQGEFRGDGQLLFTEGLLWLWAAAEWLAASRFACLPGLTLSLGRFLFSL